MSQSAMVTITSRVKNGKRVGLLVTRQGLRRSQRLKKEKIDDGSKWQGAIQLNRTGRKMKASEGNNISTDREMDMNPEISLL